MYTHVPPHVQKPLQGPQPKEISSTVTEKAGPILLLCWNTGRCKNFMFNQNYEEKAVCLLNKVVLPRQLNYSQSSASEFLKKQKGKPCKK